MGGIPARVASGFSPGLQQRAQGLRGARYRRALVGRAYFPPYGWITFDPTPPRRRPARSSTTVPGPAAADAAAELRGAWAVRRPPVLARRPRRRLAPTERRRLEAARRRRLVALMALLGGVALWRRRTPVRDARAELAELQRALHRSGRDPSPDVTLARLEGARRLGRGRRLRARGARPAPRARGRRPTRAQRRALRRQLGSGLGWRGVLRSWWALRRCCPGAQGSSRAVRTLEVGMDSAYDLFMNGTGCWTTVTSTRPSCRWRAPRPRADKASVREALGRALFGARRYRAGARSSGPSSSTRRPTTTRSSASAARCSCRAATPRRASRWRSRRACARSARTTRSTSAGRAAARPERLSPRPRTARPNTLRGAILPLQLSGPVPGRCS